MLIRDNDMLRMLNAIKKIRFIKTLRNKCIRSLLRICKKNRRSKQKIIVIIK